MRLNKYFIAILLIIALFSAISGCVATSKATGKNEKLPEEKIGSTGAVSFVYQSEPVVYTTVRAADGNIWLQQNLGAKNVATSINNGSSFGDLYAWGRWTDGHEQRLTPLVRLNSAPNPNNPKGLNDWGENPFYTHTKSANFWWIKGTAQDTWENTLRQGANENEGCDPCRQLGEKWRMPTKEEWENLIEKEKITNLLTAYESNLKIPVAGYRAGNDGQIKSEGKVIRLWTRTAGDNGSAYLVNITLQGADIPAYSRSGGLSIRCIRK